MLTPEQVDGLRVAAGRISDPLNDWVIRDIAKRIQEAGQLTSTAQYQVWLAQQLGVSQRQLRQRLRKLLDISHRDVRRLLTQSAEVGYRFDLSHLPTAGAIPFSQNVAMQQIVQASVALADGELTNITQTLGLVDPFGRAMPLQDAYRNAIDFAFKQTSTGAADYNTAIRQASANIAKYGLRSIDYASGRSVSLEAAVRGSVMGGLGLMQEKISQHNHDEMGADGWEISAHEASAPDHEPIQGRQYSDAEYAALNGSLQRRIGTLNCGHSAHPIILGVSESVYTDEELRRMQESNKDGVTVAGKRYTMYEATQQQRAIERAIRAQKRKVLLTVGDDHKAAATRLTVLQQEYKRFSRAAGLRTEDERLHVSGFGVREAAEARQAAQQQTLTNAAGQRIIVVKHTALTGEPNSITQRTSAGGNIDRNYYGEFGWQIKQVSSTNHNHKPTAEYGDHGEHAHDYVYDGDGKLQGRPYRELTDDERKENGDIL